MALNLTQLTALKNDIAASEFASLPNNDDSSFAIAAAYNLLASPDYTLWRKSVAITQVGQAFKATELAGLTSLNHTRLQTLAIYLSDGLNPSLADVRGFFDDIFSGAGGVNTRASLLALWKRLATRAEKLFATGTGSDASPATSAFGDGFTLSFQDVSQARNLP